MTIEKIIIGGRRSGKTTRLIEWLKKQDKPVLISTNMDVGNEIAEQVRLVTLKVVTLNMRNWKEKLRGYKNIGIDEPEYMNLLPDDLKWLIRNKNIFIVGGIKDFVFSPFLRLIELFPDKAELINNPNVINDINGVMNIGLNTYDGYHLRKEMFMDINLRELTLDDIMEIYHRPFSDVDSDGYLVMSDNDE